MECLWYCFAPVIQKDLDIVKEHWNSRTVPGRPDSLFYLPEFHRVVGNLLPNVGKRQRDCRKLLTVAVNCASLEMSFGISHFKQVMPCFFLSKITPTVTWCNITVQYICH